MGVRAQVNLIKVTNKTLSARYLLSRRKRVKGLSLAYRFAKLFAFLILSCVLAVAPWQFLEISEISPLCLECASLPFLLTPGLQVPRSATSSTGDPHPPLCTQPVFSIVLSTRSMGMCVYAWCILDVAEFADLGESLLSLLGSVCCRLVLVQCACGTCILTHQMLINLLRSLTPQLSCDESTVSSFPALYVATDE